MTFRLRVNKSAEMEADLKEVEKSIDLMQAPVGSLDVVFFFDLLIQFLEHVLTRVVLKKVARQKVATSVKKADAEPLEE